MPIPTHLPMPPATTAPATPDKKRHHWIVRATHWVNVVALTLMIGSGLRIFNAYPAFARKGEAFCCWPWEGTPIPGWLTFGGGLAGARNWHFAMMWLLALNGFAYLAFIWLHGEWRDLAPRRGDVRDAWEMIKFYLFVRKTHPHQGKHNALQKTVYFALPWLGVLAVLTGLAIWKPVQLAPLTGLFGGYVWARYWHFVVMLLLVLLALGHVFMVFAVDPASLASMVTGRYDESRSPEALNARPFLRRKPKPVSAFPASPAAPPAATAAAATLMTAETPRPVPVEAAPAGPVEPPQPPEAGTGALEAIELARRFSRGEPLFGPAPSTSAEADATAEDGESGNEDAAPRTDDVAGEADEPEVER